jgi:hypothetical protein
MGGDGPHDGPVTSRLSSLAVLNEAQFNRDRVEMQMAHADNTVRGVHNAAEWLAVRRTMIQWWANYLEAQRA